MALQQTQIRSSDHEAEFQAGDTVDQKDRLVPRNLRQSGTAAIEMLISNRVRKSPFWHLSVKAGAWRATVYNRMYHPRGYFRPEEGGAMAEYDALINRVTLWDVSVERQIRVKGPDAEAFVDFVITRDATRIEPMRAKYCILCNRHGKMLNDPVVLRLAEDEFWFSISDSDLALWLDGVNVFGDYEVEIGEIDVAPLQIQGPRSEKLMRDLLPGRIRELPYYGLTTGEIADVPVVVSQTGFSGEKGYEIYVTDATRNADLVWNAICGAGERHGLAVIAPAHHRRIAAGILSWGQDMDTETSPFQVNLDYQVPRRKHGDYIGRKALEEQRERIEVGDYPFALKMVGLTFAGSPVTDHVPDFWLVSGPESNNPVGYITSVWWSPELETNIALAFVPPDRAETSTELMVHVPLGYAETPDQPERAVVVDLPFRKSEHPSAREVAARKGHDWVV